ncbi:MAG: hypothetical protein K6E99_00945 [Bacilli bacterium]|nr:hypothetical protein [Bacilli bacterium]
MKVFRDNCVYVQMDDLVQLLTLSDGVPDTIMKKLHSENEITVDDTNRFDFVKFDLPEEVFFFKRQDWIIDYENYKDLDDEKLEKIAHELYLNSESIVNNFNILPKDDQKSNYGRSMLMEHVKLRHIIHNLRHLAAYKSGVMNMVIPGEELGEVLDITQEQAKKAVFR